MAYVSPDCPIPQNGRMPPPQRCVDASNAAIALADRIAMDGRLRVYAAMPRLSSFRAMGPGVVASAAIMTHQSDLARSSVISAGAPPTETSTLYGVESDAPTVFPLNWIPEVERISACAPGVPSAERAVLEQTSVVMPQRLNERDTTRALVRRGAGGGVDRRAGRAAGFPAWADAAVYDSGSDGLGGWLSRNPLLAVGLLAVGVIAFTGKRRGR